MGRRRNTLRLAATPLLVLAIVRPLAAAEDAGETASLAREGDWELVQTNCTTCHSALLITQNSGDRGVWRSRLAWMVETHGMPSLEAELEERILVYLTEYYGPRQSTRRAPLAAHLLPPNPLSTP